MAHQSGLALLIFQVNNCNSSSSSHMLNVACRHSSVYCMRIVKTSKYCQNKIYEHVIVFENKSFFCSHSVVTFNDTERCYFLHTRCQSYTARTRLRIAISITIAIYSVRNILSAHANKIVERFTKHVSIHSRPIHSPF